MAKTPKTNSNDSGDEILDAVEASAPETPARPSKADTKSAKQDAQDKKAADEIDDRNPVVAFIYDHPWIALFIGYLILTALIRVWGWATILFLLIPIICFGRIWMLSRNTDDDIDHETHLKLYWWSRAGFISSIFGLASAFILNWFGILHIFN